MPSALIIYTEGLCYLDVSKSAFVPTGGQLALHLVIALDHTGFRF